MAAVDGMDQTERAEFDAALARADSGRSSRPAPSERKRRDPTIAEMRARIAAAHASESGSHGHSADADRIARAAAGGEVVIG